MLCGDLEGLSYKKEAKLVQKETLTVNTHEGIQSNRNLMDFELA